MNAGDILYTGATVSEAGAKAYNIANEACERFEREGREIPEQLLNGRHNLFQSLALGAGNHNQETN